MNTRFQRTLSVCYGKMSWLCQVSGNIDEALRFAQARLQISESLAAADSSNVQFRHDLGLSYGRVGLVLIKKGDPGQATLYLRKGLKSYEDFSRADPANANLRMGVIVLLQ